MKTTRLGSLETSVIGLGCMGMSQAYGPADPAENARTLHRALDIGVSFFDTASAYGSGHNEELIGRILPKRRHEYVLATKFGIVRNADGSNGVDGRPEHVAARCEESLKRLNTDRIDLYYLHRLDRNVPIEDTVGAMADLVRAGKVRHLGLSEISAKTLRRAHAVHPISAVQSEYSLWTRNPERHVLPACRELGVGFVPFSPLGRGMLTGRFNDGGAWPSDDLRGSMPRFTGANFAANRALVAELESYAAARGHTAAQLGLAWLVAQGEGIASIPGTKRVSFLEEDMAAADIVLSADEVSYLSALFAPEKVAGHRYPPGLAATIDED
ncbi:MAG: aldo/keto reductase [Vicinamibacterales bacterium]